MRGERLIALVDGPYMDIVDEGHAFYLFNFVAQLEHINMLGRAFQQHISNPDNQMAGVPQDEQGDNNTQYRVNYEYVNSDPILKCEDKYRRNDNGNRPKQVGNNMLQGALDIQAMLR